MVSMLTIKSMKSQYDKSLLCCCAQVNTMEINICQPVTNESRQTLTRQHIQTIRTCTHVSQLSYSLCLSDQITSLVQNNIIEVNHVAISIHSWLCNGNPFVGNLKRAKGDMIIGRPPLLCLLSSCWHRCIQRIILVVVRAITSAIRSTSTRSKQYCHTR